MNKKTVILFTWTGLVLLALPLALNAAPLNVPPLSSGGGINILAIFDKIFDFIWPLFIGFAILIFIFAGYMFLTAKGEPNKIKLAKDAFVWGVIGVAVGLMSYSVILTVRWLLP